MTIINRIINIKNEVMLININSEGNLTAVMHSIKIITTMQLSMNITLIFTSFFIKSYN